MNHAPDDMREAVAAYRAVLEVHTKEQTPAQWVRSEQQSCHLAQATIG